MAHSTNAVLPEDSLPRVVQKMVHDLNNFSTVIRTYSELLLADLPEDSTHHADVREINQATDEMVRYLQRVMRFTRAPAMRRVNVDIVGGVDDAIAAIEPGFRGLTVSAQGSARDAVHADVTWWREVMIELLRNACEASPVNAAVLIEIMRDVAGRRVIVRVIDAGPGFPPAVHEDAAEPFVTTKYDVRGAGLGLTIVNAFVRAIEGSLSWSRETTAAGERTVVTLALPTVRPL